jgi:predicted nucleic-acid-binding protein
MIGVDTNVLVRYIVEDDPAQGAAAAALIDRVIRKGEKLFVPQVVLCELVWVLTFAYRFRRDEVLRTLQQLRRGAHLIIEGPDDVRRAVDAYAAGRGDFADYLIGERSTANGCAWIVTFDRVLHSDARFVSPSAV